MRVEAAGRELEGVTVIVQNSDPFTYFRKRPIRVAEGAGLDERHARARGAEAGHAARAAHADAAPALGQRQARCCATARSRASASWRTLRVDAIDDRPFPVQVDGDFIGEFGEIESRVAPGALLAVGS